jgi:hypothetical protein
MPGNAARLYYVQTCSSWPRNNLALVLSLISSCNEAFVIMILGADTSAKQVLSANAVPSAIAPSSIITFRNRDPKLS